MKASDFDTKFDNGEYIINDLDLKKGKCRYSRVDDKIP